MIDFHTHALPWRMLPDPFFVARVNALRAAGRTRSDDVGKLTEKMRRNVDDPRAELLEADLRAAGVTHAVLLGMDWGLLDDGATAMHPREQLGVGLDVVERTNGFFSFVVAVDPRRPDAREVIDEAFRHDSVVGVKLYPPMGYWPDDKVCDPVYEAATETGRFVMFHTGKQSYPFFLEYGRLERYANVQHRWPEARLVLGHAGATLWGEEAIEVARGHPNTYLEVSGWHTILAHEPERVTSFLRAAWRALGPKRVLFGSDHLSGKGSSAKVPEMREWRAACVAAAAAEGVSEEQLDAAAAALLDRP